MQAPPQRPFWETDDDSRLARRQSSLSDDTAAARPARSASHCSFPDAAVDTFSNPSFADPSFAFRASAAEAKDSSHAALPVRPFRRRRPIRRTRSAAAPARSRASGVASGTSRMGSKRRSSTCDGDAIDLFRADADDACGEGGQGGRGGPGGKRRKSVEPVSSFEVRAWLLVGVSVGSVWVDGMESGDKWGYLAR